MVPAWCLFWASHVAFSLPEKFSPFKPPVWHRFDLRSQGLRRERGQWEKRMRVEFPSGSLFSIMLQLPQTPAGLKKCASHSAQKNIKKRREDQISESMFFQYLFGEKFRRYKTSKHPFEKLVFLEVRRCASKLRFPFRRSSPWPRWPWPWFSSLWVSAFANSPNRS